MKKLLFLLGTLVISSISSNIALTNSQILNQKVTNISTELKTKDFNTDNVSLSTGDAEQNLPQFVAVLNEAFQYIKENNIKNWNIKLLNWYQTSPYEQDRNHFIPQDQLDNLHKIMSTDSFVAKTLIGQWKRIPVSETTFHYIWNSYLVYTNNQQEGKTNLNPFSAELPVQETRTFNIKLTIEYSEPIHEIIVDSSLVEITSDAAYGKLTAMTDIYDKCYEAMQLLTNPRIAIMVIGFLVNGEIRAAVPLSQNAVHTFKNILTDDNFKLLDFEFHAENHGSDKFYTVNMIYLDNNVEKNIPLSPFFTIHGLFQKATILLETELIGD
ncbi:MULTISPECIES: hypothetical protein [Spiroplasma]|uniref:Uncharacterized protein n=1 Tax=Spiroplasma eriocheiris TaxID=315358 RepID=A0A0H3XMA5_9MOLU|nr:hypothetical protein [Spiroplasma eriocheiris]AHF57570.1 hypothetical protein SPE_0441 [Spiroplasma eriocheiris CCTCC M 207170]AKM54027.1 hypothetical protein SERIO_v1c04480 [Spiroplasma eriocheiris]